MKKTFYVLGLMLAFNAVAGDEGPPQDPPAKIEGVSAFTSCPKGLDGKVAAIGKNVEHYMSKGRMDVAAAILSRCATFGSSRDSSLIGPVVQKWQEMLQSKLTAASSNDMTRLSKECWTRLAGENGEHGTLGMSAAAHCDLRVVQMFASMYSGE